MNFSEPKSKPPVTSLTWGGNADINIGHLFAILMTYVCTHRTSCSGAG